MANLFAPSFVLGVALAKSQGVTTSQAFTDGLLSALARQPLGWVLALFLARKQAVADAAAVSAPRARTTTALISGVIGGSGDPIDFTATITSTPAKAPAPTGMVTFSDGVQTLAIIPVQAASALFTTDSLPKGPHSVTASYGGDANNLGSTSAPVTFTL
jgi:hypothetical protein